VKPGPRIKTIPKNAVRSWLRIRFLLFAGKIAVFAVGASRFYVFMYLLTRRRAVAAVAWSQRGAQ
jgi:hypothetical protein